MFYKQLWSSISTDITDDRTTQQHAAENGLRHRFICRSPPMVRRLEGDDCSKLHICGTFRDNRIPRCFLNASTADIEITLSS